MARTMLLLCAINLTIMRTRSQIPSDDEIFKKLASSKNLRVETRWVCVPPNQCIDNEVDTKGVNTMRDRSYLYCKDPTRVPCEYTGTLNTLVPALLGNTTDAPTSTEPFTQETTTNRIRSQFYPKSSSRLVVKRLTGCGIRSTNVTMFRSYQEVDHAEAGEFPWTVAIFRKPKTYVRVGSLIHHKVVLTVAHLFNTRRSRRNLFIRAGITNRASTNTVTQMMTRDVERVITHDDFDSGSLANNIALMVLSSDIAIGANIGFACLPVQSQQPVPSTLCTVTGWGSVIKGGEMEKRLKLIEIPVVEHESCQKALTSHQKMNPEYILPDSVMCAGGEPDEDDAIPDTCDGDGGAPLVCPYPQSTGRYYQAGITSWGLGCGTPGIPALYTSVAVLRPWIDGKMRELSLPSETYTPPNEV